MKVIAFEPSYNEKHKKILRHLAAGIPGATVRPIESYKPCDVAIIFGGVKKSYPATWTKKKVLENHAGRRLLMVESAFQRRGEYYQIGWGGTAGNADFRTDAATPIDRFDALQLDVRRWRGRHYGPIVVCGQLPRDVQVQDVDHCQWIRDTVDFYVRQGEQVWFRPHPKMDSVGNYGVPKKLTNCEPLEKVLDVARCFVTWNSTSAVDAVIAGVPVIAMDRGSMAWPVASHDLTHLDHMPQRLDWFAGLGYSQWTLEEMADGLPWQWLTR